MLALVAVCGTLQVWETFRVGELMTVPVSVFFFLMFLAGSMSGVYLLSRTKMVRRYTFANLMAREVEKRRGRGSSRHTPAFSVNDLLRPIGDGREGSLRPHAARVAMQRYYH